MSEIDRFATFTLETLGEFNDQIGWVNKWNEDNNWDLDSMEAVAGALKKVIDLEFDYQDYLKKNHPGEYCGSYETFLQSLKSLLYESDSYKSYLEKAEKKGS